MNLATYARRLVFALLGALLCTVLVATSVAAVSLAPAQRTKPVQGNRVSAGQPGPPIAHRQWRRAVVKQKRQLRCGSKHRRQVRRACRAKARMRAATQLRQRRSAALAAAVVPGPLPTSAPSPVPAPAPVDPGPGGPVTDEFSFVAEEDFNAPSLNTSRWGTYSGVPGCCSDTLWSGNRVKVSGGALHVWNQPDANGRWLSGGVGGWKWQEATRTYGRYEARMKLAPGVNTSAAGLLWPVKGWPPEIDFYEFSAYDGDRTELMITTHWGSAINSASEPHYMDQKFIRGNFTQWHTVAVEWTPTRLDYFLDGLLVRHVTNPAAIPDQPMWPAFQVHVHKDKRGYGPTPGPDGTSGDFAVDYLKVWRYNGR